MTSPDDKPVAAGDEPTTDEETPEVIAHSDDEELPVVSDCTGFQGACVSF